MTHRKTPSTMETSQPREELSPPWIWETTNTQVADIISLGGYAFSPDRDAEFQEKYGERYLKLKRLNALWVQLNPEKFDRDTKSTYIEANKENLPTSSEISESEKQLSLAWRIISIRDQWKVVFFDIQDSHGRLQIYVKKSEISDIESQMIDLLDRGDFIGVCWHAFVTGRWQASLYARSLKFLGKALRSLPDKHEGVKDREMKYRQPYLDTIMDPDAREKLKLRSNVVSEIRRFMDDNEFLEIETPILWNTASWALASSFMTQHNALGIPLHLRIAPETNLKKAVVWGFEKVYEIGKQFRNEWMSPNHLQEFTSMEFYWSYVDKTRLMDFTRELFLHILEKVKGSTSITYLGKEIEFSGEWPRYTLRDLIKNNSFNRYWYSAYYRRSYWSYCIRMTWYWYPKMSK